MSYGEVLLAPLICVYVCVKRLLVRPGESVIRLTFVLIPTSIWYHHYCDQIYHRTAKHRSPGASQVMHEAERRQPQLSTVCGALSVMYILSHYAHRISAEVTRSTWRLEG